MTVVAAEPDALETLHIMAEQIGLAPDTLPRKAPFQIEINAPNGSRKRIVDMLSALGIRVRLDEDAAETPVAAGITPQIWAQRDGLAAPLAALVGQSRTAIATALAQPGGVILPALHPDEAERLRRAVRRIRGLSITLSDPSTAICDLFTVAAPSAELLHHLRLIGQPADPLTGAMATALDESMCRHLRQRFPSETLLLLDRAFQRFDILLTGTGPWVRTDLADFLTGRTALPRARFEAISPEHPIKVELGLTRQAALQFHGDYAAIGLETRLVLTGSENS